MLALAQQFLHISPFKFFCVRFKQPCTHVRSTLDLIEQSVIILQRLIADHPLSLVIQEAGEQWILASLWVFLSYYRGYWLVHHWRNGHWRLTFQLGASMNDEGGIGIQKEG
jgi:hypothetical protein